MAARRECLQLQQPTTRSYVAASGEETAVNASAAPYAPLTRLYKPRDSSKATENSWVAG